MPTGTQSSKSDLMTAFDDNAIQAIEESDHRDYIESMDLTHGLLYVSSSAATTIASSGTWTKVAGTTTSLLTNRLTHTDNRFTYTGTPDIRAVLRATISFTIASAREMEFAFAVDGSVLTGTAITVDAAAGDYMAVSIIGYDLIANGSYAEVFVRNNDTDDDPTIEQMVFELIGHFA